MPDLIAELWGFLRRQRGNGTTPETYNIPVTIESGGSGSGPTGAPADGGATQAGAYSNDQNLVYNGATWDLMRAANAASNTPGVGLAGAGALVWDGANWQRLSDVAAGGLNLAGTSLGTKLAGEDQVNNLMRIGSKGPTWAVTHAPAISVKATITRAAAGVGIQNVCTGVSFGIATGTTPAVTAITFNLRDGATGAGTILQSWTIVAPNAAGYNFSMPIGQLWIEGSANTAMTLEAVSALSLCYQYVNLVGTTLP